MKRHESLAPLSREHHGGLILAQLLKKGAPAYRGLPTDTAGKLGYARECYEELLEGHFLQEETMLRLIEGQHPEIDMLAKEITEEHTRITNMFHRLSFAHTNIADQLDELGHALEMHIRKEERILFPLMQEKCSVSELQDIERLMQNQQHEEGYPKPE